MANLNRAQVIGNLGDDPELRYTNDNTPVCTMRVATNENWTDRQTGEKRQSTEWHRVVVWGKQAENCSQYLSKGREVYVEGKLQTRRWEDREGNERYTTEIRASNVQFLGGGNGGSNDNASGDNSDHSEGFGPDTIPG